MTKTKTKTKKYPGQTIDLDAFRGTTLRQKLRWPRSGLTSTDRLLMAAVTIEEHPEHHDQDAYFQAVDQATQRRVNDHLDVTALRSAAPLCGSTCCAAGWGVTYSPADLVKVVGDWDRAGAEAFGLDEGLAIDLFYWTDFDDDDHDEATLIAAALYLLASKPEGKRNGDHFPDIREMAREAVYGA